MGSAASVATPVSRAFPSLMNGQKQTLPAAIEDHDISQSYSVSPGLGSAVVRAEIHCFKGSKLGLESLIKTFPSPPVL